MFERRSVWMFEGLSVWMFDRRSVWMFERRSVWMFERRSVWMIKRRSIWMFERHSNTTLNELSLPDPQWMTSERSIWMLKQHLFNLSVFAGGTGQLETRPFPPSIRKEFSHSWVRVWRRTSIRPAVPLLFSELCRTFLMR